MDRPLYDLVEYLTCLKRNRVLSGREVRRNERNIRVPLCLIFIFQCFIYLHTIIVIVNL